MALNNKQQNILSDMFGEQKRWVNWRYEKVGKKITKVPYQINGKKAETNNPLTWSTYAEVIEVSPDHIGIVFTPDQLLLGVDLDDCLEGDVILGEEKEKIEKFVKEANTYTEISPSNTGLHSYLLLTAPLQLIANKSDDFEAYTSVRYFTVTNNPYKEPLAIRTVTPEAALALLSIIGYPWKKEIKKQRDTSTSAVSIMDDETLLSKMFASRNGEPMKALYEGDISEYKSESEADLALCGYLTFWTGRNAEQMERLWLGSPLGARNKTQERQDYRNRTIVKAIEGCPKIYHNAGKGKKPISKEDETLESPENIEEQIKYAFGEKDKKLAVYMLAQYLIQKHNIKTIKGTKREVLVYEDGIYTSGEDVLKMDIREVLEEACSAHYVKEVIEAIKDITATDRDIFKVDPHLINLRNGVFDIRTKELSPHDPKYLFFTKLPVTYTPGVDCPTVKKYLSQVLDEEQIVIIQEWFGYAMYREYFIKKALICVGEGDTGKSTLITLFSKFLGKDNVSGISLQSITSDKFAASHLYGKHINLYDDLASRDIQDNGGFKIATGGGVITGEKKFGDQFVFTNYAKLTFACNKIPDVKESSDGAYFNRWIVLFFSRVIEEEDQDKQLIHKISTDEELSGLLNFAIEGLERLLKNGRFSYDKGMDEIKNEMLRSASPIVRFVGDALLEATDEWISKEDMYEAFKVYIQANKLPMVSMSAFGRRFPMSAPYISVFKPKDPATGNQITAWRNVKLKAIEPEDTSEE